MTKLDCPICHKRYSLPEDMKNHSEEVHHLNRGYLDWIFLLEDRISQLEANSMLVTRFYFFLFYGVVWTTELSLVDNHALFAGVRDHRT